MNGASTDDLVQPGSRVRVGWGLPGLQVLAPHVDVVVVVDVLSFSTAVAVAREAGAEIVPWDPAEAFPPDVPVVGRREGGGVSLSPASLRGLRAGSRWVIPSPNGSRLCAWARAHRIAVRTGCIRDRRATAAALEHADAIALIAAGERWPAAGPGDATIRFALEDWLGVGAIATLLEGPWSPEARAACAAYTDAAATLEATLRATASGRELVRRGFADDVALAAGRDP